MKLLLALLGFAAGISIACSSTRSATSPAPENNTSTSQSTPIVNSIAQDKTRCVLSISQAPAIKGLKLGMTPDEVMTLFAGSKDDADLRSQLARPPSQFGTSSFVVRPERYENKTDFSGISQITFTLLDGRVFSITAQHNGPEWPDVDEFVTKFTEGTGLPPAAQWEAYPGLDRQMKTLTCTDFSVRLYAGGEGGSQNYVMIQDLQADKQLKDRRKKAREKASPPPGSQ
jgi:hypothetical protein